MDSFFQFHTNSSYLSLIHICLSVNVEIPKEENLKLLAPEKDHKSVFAPMKYIQQGVLAVSYTHLK